MFGGHWQPGSSPKLPFSLFLYPSPFLAPKGNLGVDAWYRPKQVPLTETDKSASYGADPSCHGQVRSAAADVVVCHILRGTQQGNSFSRRRSASEGPVNCGIVYVICDSGTTTLDPSTHTNTLAGDFSHTSVVMAIVKQSSVIPSSGSFTRCLEAILTEWIRRPRPRIPCNKGEGHAITWS